MVGVLFGCFGVERYGDSRMDCVRSEGGGAEGRGRMLGGGEAFGSFI